MERDSMKNYDELEKEYASLSDTELADEFNLVDAYIQRVWSDTDQETSDRWDVLSDMIHERFISLHASSYITMIDPKISQKWFNGGNV